MRAALRWLRRHGREMAAPSLSSKDPCRVFHAATPEVEIAAVAEWAEAQLRSREFRAWVCVPDLSLRREEVIDAFDALAKAGRTPEAIAEFEAALRLEPGSAKAHYNLGVVLWRIGGRLPEALAHFDAALRISPDPDRRRMVERLRATQR